MVMRMRNFSLFLFVPSRLPMIVPYIKPFPRVRVGGEEETPYGGGRGRRRGGPGRSEIRIKGRSEWMMPTTKGTKDSFIEESSSSSSSSKAREVVR